MSFHNQKGHSHSHHHGCRSDRRCIPSPPVSSMASQTATSSPSTSLYPPRPRLRSRATRLGPWPAGLITYLPVQQRLEMKKVIYFWRYFRASLFMKQCAKGLDSSLFTRVPSGRQKIYREFRDIKREKLGEGYGGRGPLLKS